MENKLKQYVCALCGYTADSKFEGDICPNCGLTYWKCEKCGFLITAAKPPDVAQNVAKGVISWMLPATFRSVAARDMLIAGCKKDKVFRTIYGMLYAN
jgi:rubredoxin